MGQGDDKRALLRIMDLFRAVSVIIAVGHIYWHSYVFFSNAGLGGGRLDVILLKLDAALGVFSSPLKARCWIMLFLMMSVFGSGRTPEKAGWGATGAVFAVGSAVFWGSVKFPPALAVGYLLVLLAVIWTAGMLMADMAMRDLFNTENESFPQEGRKMENRYSVNLRTRYRYRGRMRNGWINIVNPFRATIVLGTPGSGKSFAVINSYIRQQIEKGYAMYIYDYKYPDLTEVAYNHLRRNMDRYAKKPQFRIINFDDPRHSHRCNPIHPDFMTDIADAYESAYVIMLNLNRSWVSKQGDFFVESPIILLAAVIWFLKIYAGGRYCTFPHAIELINTDYKVLFSILKSYQDLENYLSPFVDAWKGGAADQLQGQIASAKIPLSRLISPKIYWVMSDSQFGLDINSPDEPKILAVGNNPDRQNIYGAALGLYNSRIVKLINRKGKLHSSVIIDELPTIYFKGLDNLIATARSNKVAVCLGFQDFSQLVRDYGEKEARVVMNTVGNIFSGQVVGETARQLSERFGKILQKRESMSDRGGENSRSVSTQMDTLIPASKISTLSQGMFVGAVSDNHDEKISQKIFHAEIVVDMKAEEEYGKSFTAVPEVTSFLDKDGKDRMEQLIRENYLEIKDDVKRLVADECRRLGIDMTNPGK